MKKLSKTLGKHCRYYRGEIMCGIGFYGPILNSERDKLLIMELLKTLTKRGKDGYGFIVISEDGKYMLYRHHSLDQVLMQLHYTELRKGDIVLVHSRARPISELIHEEEKEKDIELLQPIVKHKIAVVFNGIIENDEEFRENEEKWVDTFAICKYHSLPTYKDKVLKGSYSYIYVDLDEPQKIHAIKGNQPLYAYENVYTGQMILSSEPIKFENFYSVKFPVATEMALTFKVQQYIFGLLTTYKCEYEMTPIKIHNSVNTPDPDKSKAVVLCSGGLDSCVVAYEMAKQCNHIILLNFDYGQPARKQEWNATLKLYEYLQKQFPEKTFEVVQLKLDVLSTLASKSTVFNEPPEGTNALETLSRWIPARNLVFLSLAVSYAEYCGAGKIAYGGNLEEACVFPDNTTEAIEKFNEAVQWFIAKPKIQIICPTAYDMKVDIVRKAIEYGVYDISWSCDRDGETECGQCEGCLLKRKAHRLVTYHM